MQVLQNVLFRVIMGDFTAYGLVLWYNITIIYLYTADNLHHEGMTIMDEEELGRKSKAQDTENIPDEVGTVKVADEVLSIVAGLAVAEVPGVAGMSGGIVGEITGMLGKQNFSKGVKVIPTGKTVVVEIHVLVKYGFIIPDVAIAIQEKVKVAVENMTGFDVTAVDVHVEGIRRLPEANIYENDEGVVDADAAKNPETEGSKP